MESVTDSNNFLLNQVRNLLQSERQVRGTVVNSRVRANIPGPENKTETGSKKPAENVFRLEKTKLYIKNMVSIRCKMVLKAVLENLGLNYSKVELGEVEIIGNLSDAKLKLLKYDLLKFGLDLMEDRKVILVEKIKNVIVEMVHYSDELPTVKFSDYLSEKLNHSYSYLSDLFSEVKGMSIQHFVLLHKIERVKELLVYEDLTLSEIAWELNYSSVAHLSSQFKKMTGLTPTHFKNMKHKRLTALEDL